MDEDRRRWISTIRSFFTPRGLRKAFLVFHPTHQTVALALTTSTSRCELFSDAPHRRY
ncbi:hypothetical protein HYDPIDRAFT_115428 [Hydnomerulius pinastri MD-312]|uniref:Uncharacterized protein n=1 Tax=Hydnomerulius pinastri MD-312 TaxID=994086 RepID=A0A0C9V7Q1_9AGAM|nr:hypothetical protein HYDPIDRAFT_115428 [Hydnomerulius pinastri MD-312]